MSFRIDIDNTIGQILCQMCLLRLEEHFQYVEQCHLFSSYESDHSYHERRFVGVGGGRMSDMSPPLFLEDGTLTRLSPPLQTFWFTIAYRHLMQPYSPVVIFLC